MSLLDIFSSLGIERLGFYRCIGKDDVLSTGTDFRRWTKKVQRLGILLLKNAPPKKEKREEEEDEAENRAKIKLKS